MSAGFVRRTVDRGTVKALGAAILAFALIAAPTAAQAKSVDSWWFDQLHLADAHKQTIGKGVTVAVIDQALDTSVPDLKGANIQFGQACDSDAKTKPAIGKAWANHGTAMTTIIAGQGTGNAAGGAGVTGAAPDATIRFYSGDSQPSTEKFDCSEFRLAKQFTRAVETVPTSSAIRRPVPLKSKEPSNVQSPRVP